VTVPPIIAEPTPQFDLPEAPQPRAYGGWFVLIALFSLMIGLELYQYLGRGEKPGSKYTAPAIQLRTTVEMKAAVAALGVKTTESQLNTAIADVAADVKADSLKNEVAARIYAVAMSEQRKPVPDGVLKVLRASKEPRDKTFAEIFGAKTISKVQAKEFESKLKGGGFISRLATIHAFDKAGDKSKREQLVTPEKAYFKLGALTGVAFAVVTGICLWIVYGALKGFGMLKRVGFPLEKITLTDADRLALRCAQTFALFLAVPLTLSFVFQAIGSKALDKTTANLVVYVALGAAVIYLFKFPIHGKRFSLGDIGLHSKNLGINIAWGVGAAIANLPVVYAAGILGQWLFRGLPAPEHPITSDIQAGLGPYAIVATLLIGSVAAPILEEIMFRGTLLPALSRVLGRPALAILLQGLIFAAIHPTGIPAWFALAAVGSTSGFLSRQTGSLVPSIVMHSVHNFGTLVFALAMFS
jgi:membrane protease YdiL (CAAX protease family)